VRSTNVSAGESVASNPQTAGRIVETEVTTFAPREGRNMTRQTNEARPHAHLAAVGLYESHFQGTFGSPSRRVRPLRGVAYSHSAGYSQPRRGILRTSC
jgi:hypothetical protein